MAIQKTKSELAIPMNAQGQVIGVLDLESPQLNYFTEDHVQTLSILAANSAVSLEKRGSTNNLAKEEAAALNADLQGGKNEFKGRFTASAHRRLWARYGGAVPIRREVCGDLYEFFAVRPQQLGIALGDVSGKGTAAALYGAVAIGIMRSLAPPKIAAGGNVAADESAGGGAAYRRPVYDRNVSHLAKEPPETARGDAGSYRSRWLYKDGAVERLS